MPSNASGGWPPSSRESIEQSRASRVLPRLAVPHPHVVVDATVMDGSPVVAESRVPVRRLWAWFRRGVSVETLLKRYPQLGPAKVLDALSFAYDNAELIEADLARERALVPNAEDVPGAMRQATLPFAPVPPKTPRR